MLMRNRWLILQHIKQDESLSVPCPFRKWTIIAFHKFLSFVALSKVCLFSISPNLCFANQLYKIPK